LGRPDAGTDAGAQLWTAVASDASGDRLVATGWFPLAEVNGGSTRLYFDDAPNAHGRRGQIIVYQHDPDEVFYVADDFAGFLVTSNDLLERCWDELFFETGSRLDEGARRR
jgi:cell wall assembly regulator SMI1